MPCKIHSTVVVNDTAYQARVTVLDIDVDNHWVTALMALCLGIIFVTFQPTSLLKENEKRGAIIRFFTFVIGK